MTDANMTSALQSFLERSNPTFNPTTVDFTRPGVSSGQAMAQRLGISNDLSEIIDIFLNAIQTGNKTEREVYEQTIAAFNNLIGSNASTLLDALRRGNASSLTTGATRGVAAANELSALLGISDQSTQGALQMALEGINMGKRQGDAEAQAMMDAYLQQVQTALDMGQLNIEELMAMVQAWAAELAYNQQQNSIMASLEAGDGYGGGYGNGNNNNYTVIPTGVPAAGDGDGDGDGNSARIKRFTTAFKEAAADDEISQAQAATIGQLFDEWDRTGRVNDLLMADLSSLDPVLQQAYYDTFFPVAHEVLNTTRVTDPKTGAWEAVPDVPKFRVPDMRGQELTAPNPNATQYLPNSLVPQGIRIDVDGWNEFQQQELRKMAYKYAADNNKVSKDGIVISKNPNDYLDPSWDPATQQSVLDALFKANIIPASTIDESGKIRIDRSVDAQTLAPGLDFQGNALPSNIPLRERQAPPLDAAMMQAAAQGEMPNMLPQYPGTNWNYNTGALTPDQRASAHGEMLPSAFTGKPLKSNPLAGLKDAASSLRALNVPVSSLPGAPAADSQDSIPVQIAQALRALNVPVSSSAKNDEEDKKKRSARAAAAGRAAAAAQPSQQAAISAARESLSRPYSSPVAPGRTGSGPSSSSLVGGLAGALGKATGAGPSSSGSSSSGGWKKAPTGSTSTSKTTTPSASKSTGSGPSSSSSGAKGGGGTSSGNGASRSFTNPTAPTTSKGGGGTSSGNGASRSFTPPKKDATNQTGWGSR